MPLIIDANNVLETTGALPPHLAGPDLGELADLIGSSRYGGQQVYLVCDGPERPAGRDLPGGMRAIFAGAARPPRSADDVIAALIRKSSAPRDLLVVSTDREVRASARRRRCQVIDSRSFLKQLARDAAAPRGAAQPLRPTGVDDHAALTAWLEVFDPDGRLVDAVEDDLARAMEEAARAEAEAAAAEVQGEGPNADSMSEPPLPPAISPEEEFPPDVLRDAEDLLDRRDRPPRPDRR